MHYKMRNQATIAAPQRQQFPASAAIGAAKSIIRILFSTKVSMALAAVTVCAMWFHAATIADPVSAGAAMATDCLWLLPWGIVWAIRASVSGFTLMKKGGEL